MPDPIRAALILGAGWSVPAGYPLARDLIAGPIFVTNAKAKSRAQAVLDSFRDWAVGRSGPLPELFLADVRDGLVQRPPRSDDATLFASQGGPLLPWPWAVEAVTLRLAWPFTPSEGQGIGTAVLLSDKQGHRARYDDNLGSPTASTPHTAFLHEVLRGYELVGVVTTNYDTLAERTLRHRPMIRRPEPGFYYCGLPRPQWAKGSSPWDRFNDPSFEVGRGAIELRGRVPLCKLHGSLSWEVTGNTISIYRDMRLPFGQRAGAAIVPPTPEKVPEPWLERVWAGAEEALSTADVWIVVGYSLPTYDHAVRDLLRRASTPRAVALHDPNARPLADRWREATSAPVTCYPGLH